jgi:PKD domain
MRVVGALLRAAALAYVFGALGSVGGASAEAPVASFSWFPSSPHTGEPVSLASTATDATSPITSFAWDLAGGGAFGEAGPVITTSFSAAGTHAVRLLVTAADGSSSIAAAAIQVSDPPAGVLLPFPVVRVVGNVLRSGLKMRLLSVEAPPGASISVECRGRGCPLSSERQAATSTGVEAVTLRFHRFERLLRAGVVLEVRVSKPGRVGEYTRLVIRHYRPPLRLDECLDPAGITPMRCPTGE